MTITFNSIEQLDNIFDMAVSNVVESIMEETEEFAQYAVYELAYIPEEPIEYSRTWEFVDAFHFDKNKLSSYIATLYFDTSKIVTRDKMHHSMSSQDLFELLDAGLNVGGIDNVTNEGGFVDAILTWLNANFDRMVVDGFKKWGFELTKR